MISQQLSKPSDLLPTDSSVHSTTRSTPFRSVSPRPRPREPLPTAPRARVRAAPPKFYAVPHNRVAEEGETVRFQCAVAGHPDPWVTWDKDRETVTPSSRVTILEREDLRILEISDVTPNDSGLYRVTLENDLGKIEASARLEVIPHRAYSTRGLRARSSSPRPAPSYRRTYVSPSPSRYGGYGRLLSDIRGVPTPFLKWYRDTATPEQYSVSYQHENTHSSSSFNDLQAVQRLQSPASAICCPPEIVEALPFIKSVSEGNVLHLQVRVQGTQPFDVVWMKDGCVIPNSDGYNQYCENGLASLLVNDAFVQDSGDYRCEVYNTYGEAVSKCSVYVRGK